MKIRLLASVVLLSTLMLSSQAFAAFPDVLANNPHKMAIESLVDQKVLSGYQDGTFKPDQSVNRAEALKIILVGLGVSTEGRTASIKFSDVKDSAWYHPYVVTAVELGIVKGYADGSFRPNQTVTRAEAVKMSLVAAGTTLDKPTAAPFVDVKLDAWYAPHASTAKTLNVVPPQVDARWYPEATLTRGKLAELVYRLQDAKKTGKAYEESKAWLRQNFPTVDVSMKTPFGWNFKADGVGSVWILDTERSQFSMLNPYDNGGTLLMTRFSNGGGLSTSAMFNSLHASLADFTSESTIGDLDVLTVKHKDSDLIYKEWYVALPNKRLAHFQALRGHGGYQPYLEAAFEDMIGSIQFSAATADVSLDEALEAIRSVVQVDGKGTQAKNLIKDWKLIETDSIGVGTGPVDYFYSPSLNITIKYERHFDVILDLRDGQSSAF